MKRLVPVLALIVMLAAIDVAEADYRAQPETPPAKAGLTIGEQRWICKGDICASSDEVKRTDEEVCADLAARVGPLRSFAHGKRVFNAKELARCNMHARGGKGADDDRTEDERGKDRVDRPIKFGSFRTETLRVTGIGAGAPPRGSISFRTPALVVRGTRASAPPRPAVSFRTPPLIVVGTAPLTAPFGTFRTATLRVAGTGESAPPRPSISFRTGRLVVAGTGKGAPPRPSISFRTAPLRITGRGK